VAALATQGMTYDQVLVVYCSGKDCEDSAMLADKLSMAGFFNIYVFKDGFPDWEKHGWPVRRGAAR
jgi:3-mercaptopyruvate sulfurtransferase SseA